MPKPMTEYQFSMSRLLYSWNMKENLLMNNNEVMFLLSNSCQIQY